VASVRFDRRGRSARRVGGRRSTDGRHQ
jgi:hypothetical protein